MKAVSWFLTGFFALAFAWSLAQMPIPGDPTAPLSVHVSARYAAQSGMETGWATPFFAVLGDYRSFDLVLLSLLAVGACLLRWGSAREQDPPLPALQILAFLFCVLGTLALLGLGFFSMAKGCRFLDYECWTQFFPPVKARVWGATASVVLAAAVILLSFMVRSKGKP